MYYSNFSISGSPDYYWVLDNGILSIAVEGLPIHCSRDPFDWRSWFEWTDNIS